MRFSLSVSSVAQAVLFGETKKAKAKKNEPPPTVLEEKEKLPMAIDLENLLAEAEYRRTHRGQSPPKRHNLYYK